MTTKLEKNITKLKLIVGEVELVDGGVTGGWAHDLVSTRSYCTKSERSNLAKRIRELGIPCADGAYVLPEGYHVVTGAGYGGSRGLRAKQCYYAIVKEVL